MYDHLNLYTCAHYDEQKKEASHYLPFVAFDDATAIKMVRDSAKDKEGKVFVDNKVLCCIAEFYPDKLKPVVAGPSKFRIVDTLENILKEKE